jgi:hypothetical protein
MTGAGYSATPLLKKLGIKPGARVLLLNAPAGYLTLLGPLPTGVTLLDAPEDGLDFVQLFSREAADVAEWFPRLQAALAPAGALWISWPKRAARIPTDLSENLIREMGLRQGLVDVKVCAVDENWSGLKFVYRLKDRAAGAMNRAATT